MKAVRTFDASQGAGFAAFAGTLRFPADVYGDRVGAPEKTYAVEFVYFPV